jgi:hypothetical protein
MATKDEALAWLQAWEAVQTGLQANTSYTIAFPNGTTRTIQRAEMRDVLDGITYWHRVYNALDAAAQGKKERGHVTPSWT